MVEIVIYTLKIAVLSTLIAALIGIPLAFFTARRTFHGRRFILSLSAIPLCIPPLIIALGYVSFFGMNGTVNNLAKSLFHLQDSPFKFLYSLRGIVIAQGFYNFPLITGVLSAAWKQLPREEENAARLLGTSEPRIFITITLKQLSGAIAAACIPVFLFCFFSFMIVLLFSPVGKSTIEVEIYHSIRTTLDIKNGAILAILETLLSLSFVAIYSFICRKSQTNSNGISFSKNPVYKLCRFPFQPKGQKLLEGTTFTILLLAVFLFLLCPGLAILLNSQFSRIFKDKIFFQALKNTIWIGLFTSSGCCLISFIYSALVKMNKKEGSVFLQTLPLIPMAISSVVLAWCMSMIFHHGNPALLIFMEIFLYWPIAYRQIQNGMNRLSPDICNAARLLSKNKLDAILRVYLPSCKKVIFTAFGLCFAVSAGDSTLPLVLSIPRFNTLAYYTYKLAGAYRFKQACASGSVLTVLCCIIFAICRTNRWQKKPS